MKCRIIMKLKRWKRQLACLGLGLILGAAAHARTGMEQKYADGYILPRNGYGEGDASYQVYVEGLEDEAVQVDIKLSEQVYTEEEAHRACEAVMEVLPQYILGDNSSLMEVRSSLNLITYMSGYGIRLKWESGEPELINSFGEVDNQGIEESGKDVYLRVRLTDGRWPCEYVLPIKIKPPILTEKEQRQGAFMEMLSREDERQNTTESLVLPDEFQGRTLSYRNKTEAAFLPMAGLGAAAAFLLTLKEQSDVKKGEVMRKQQMMLDYSEVLSRLIIFLGAGMSIRTAWDKIAFEQHQMTEEGRRRPRYIYKEMYETSCQMKSGVSEGKAFAGFGARCGLQPYIKLSGLLEQNRKNGSKHLRDTLKLEMSEAFEQRKHQARRLGEEAGTKLLLPLFMQLSVVMVMIAVPALMEFR